MEVKKGYKKTDIGIIPEDWEIKPFIEVANLFTDQVSNGSFSTIKSNLNILETPNYALYVRLYDLRLGLGHENQKYVDEKTYNFLSNSKLIGDEILVANIGANVGETWLMPKLNSYATLAPNMILVRINEELYSRFYIYLYLNSKIGWSELKKSISGSGHPKINKTDLKKIKIVLPPKQEQSAIAQVLNDTDELISSLEKLIEKKKQIKQGVMQQLLTGKKRLPGFSGKWEVKKLKDLIFSFQNGFGFSAKEYVDSGIPIITMAQIGLDGTFQFDEENINYWPDRYLDSLKDFQVKMNDVIIAMTDVTPEKHLIGRMTQVNIDRIFLLNQRVGLLRIDIEKVHPIFLISLSNQNEWRNYSIAVASLGVQANISTKDILNGEIKIPEIDEQIAIAQILSDMEFEIKSLKQKLNKYKSIKKGMMENLLTGKIRLV